MVINKTVALQNLSKSLIGNPYDGKFVHLNGSQNILGVLTDKDWDRILIGKYKGSDSWVKSYGDHPGDSVMIWPSSVGLDQYGNIFVLTNYPRKLFHLTYNDNNESITSATQVPISSMSYMVDLCLDDNNTPGVLSDDRIWAADFDGNALYNIQWNGQIAGKYTHVLNSDGESLYFNHPSKVLVFWSWNYGGYYRIMAVIDSDGKRVIIIPTLTNIQNNSNYSIGGNFQAFHFLDETNVSLNALGFNLNQGADGLYVGDSRNGVFHIFDLYNPCYVGSINKNAFGQLPLWVNPISIFSERMSNSDNTNFPVTGGIQEFNTIDKWDENYGVNTFYSGADLVNPVVYFDAWGGVHVEGSFFGYSRVNATIFNANDVEIENLYYDCYSATNTEIATIFPGELNTIGKYYINFSLLPFWNDFYGDHKWLQPLQIKVNFAYPINGNMTGDTSGMNGSFLTWHANMTSGSGDFSYKWYIQNSGENNWNLLSSTSSSQQYVLSTQSVTIKCDVTDNYTGLTKSFSQYVRCVLSPTLYLKALIEAMYVAGGNSMKMSPTITVELHRDYSPYRRAYLQSGILSTAGDGTFNFPSAQNGIPYYIVVKYLNTIETWSAEAHSFTANELSYDFTSPEGQAYTDGSNRPLALHNGKYCLYSGDCNQDGFVSGDDFTGVDYDNENFEYHLVNDLNGDGFVSGDDYTFIDINCTNFIQKQIPSNGSIVQSVVKHKKSADKNKLQ